MTEIRTLPSAGATDGTTDCRPVLHYTAADTWLNDPNGLVYDDGTYHLFYQNNPFANVWGNMSWGHAASTDLLAWTEHPVAIPCDDLEDVYSGSIVVDHRNTSGLGSPDSPPWVAVYTSAFKDASPHSGRQAQSLAYSTDSGMTWTKFGANPVLTRDSANFRDPKVFWYSGPGDSRLGVSNPDGGYWVMVAVEALARQVLFYRSPNLREWELLSEFGPANAIGGEWECPDLFPLPLDSDPKKTRWVLTVNINPGAVAGGSGGQYFIGDFDGVRFTPDVSPVINAAQSQSGTAGEAPAFEARQSAELLKTFQWLDWGRDYYAAVSFTNAPENRRIMIGWMNNWDYANQIPTWPWRSPMSLARVVSLATVEGRPALIQNPVLPDMVPAPFFVISEPVGINNSSLDIPAVRSGAALIIRAEFESITAQRFGFVLGAGAAGHDGGTEIYYEAASSELVVDRTRSGNTDFHPLFASVDRCPVALQDGVLKLEIVVDLCSVEVFAQGGQACITDLVFPAARNGSPAAFGQLSVFAQGGTATVRKLAVTAVTAAAAGGGL
ncbi:glycoside hydrolase family 32 protein [Arthrobacter sp. ISL-69]|uniref:glycoside hydrolase family 32 protein n=1 Tax=Arthrobacter sp. ISL-69 TaxID=2819113 RepID=UPI001BE6A9D6|nr:glycoside hydrolase family 32 protein [Arthrobacter sp. ISL-69]MBT2536067.1 glycoside hydrolase family 32 protein [Arthrobacter sp. ISL-69]